MEEGGAATGLISEYPETSTITASGADVTSAAPFMTHSARTSSINKDSRRLLMQPREPNKDTDKEEKITKARNSIEQAKDRGQITAATSMSIVHVALLKDTLDAGRDSTKYYEWMLGFIVTALVLQVLAGLLALYVAVLRQYYTQYHDNFLTDCMKICCPFTCKRRKHKRLELDSWFEEEEEKETKPMNDSSSDPGGCCPWECTANELNDFDYRVLDLHEIWCEKAIKADIRWANIDSEIESVTRRRDTAYKEIVIWKEERIKNGEENPKVPQHLQDNLNAFENEKEKLEEEKEKVLKLQAQGEILKQYVGNVEKEHVLKSATFWQNALNVLFYMVFVLNAIIVGFGLATRQTTPGSSSNSTQT